MPLRVHLIFHLSKTERYKFNMAVWIWILFGLAIIVVVLIFIKHRAPRIDEPIDEPIEMPKDEPKEIPRQKRDTPKQNLHMRYNKNVKRGTDGRFKSK